MGRFSRVRNLFLPKCRIKLGTRFGIVGPEFYGRPQMPDCLIDLSTLDKQDTQVVLSIAVIGFQLDGLADLSNGSRQISLFLPNRSNAVVGLGIVRLQRNCLLELS